MYLSAKSRHSAAGVQPYLYQATEDGTDGGKIQPQSRIGAAYVPPLPICSASAADIRRAQCVPPATSDLQRLRRGGDPAVRNAYRPPLSIYSTFARAGIRPCAMRHRQKTQQAC